MKKFLLISLVVIAVVLGAGWAYTNPGSRVREPEAMAEMLASSGGYRLGVVLSDISPHLRDDLNVESGVLVDEVLSDSPAEKAGLQDGDIIVSIDGRSVDSERDIRRALRGLDEPKAVIMDVVRDGKPLKITVKPEKREISLFRNFGGPYIGVELQEMDADLAKYFQASPDSGILVARVVSGSPAEEAGLKSGDVITELNGKKITSRSDLREALDDIKDGENAKITVLRQGKSQSLTVIPEGNKFDFSELPDLRELKNLENLRELRDIPNRPEFRESMRKLRREMDELKKEMQKLKQQLKESN